MRWWREQHFCLDWTILGYKFWHYKLETDYRSSSCCFRCWKMTGTQTSLQGPFQKVRQVFGMKSWWAESSRKFHKQVNIMRLWNSYIWFIIEADTLNPPAALGSVWPQWSRKVQTTQQVRGGHSWWLLFRRQQTYEAADVQSQLKKRRVIWCCRVLMHVQ